MQDDDEDAPTDQPGDAVRITLANRIDIYSWSYGEIRTAELFDPAQSSFHPAGLFSDVIFGRLRKYEPVLKKYRDADRMARFAQSKWNMDVMNPERRTRFGHITLPVPVIHPWFWGRDDAPLELLLDLPHRVVQDIVAGRVAVDLVFPGPQLAFRTETLDESEEVRFAWEPSLVDQTGAAAVAGMLARFNYSAAHQILQERLKTNGSQFPAGQPQRLRQRLGLLRAVVEGRLSPEAFVLEALPVLPVGLRGMQLGQDGRVRTDWLTAAYRRIIRMAARYQDVVQAFVGQCRPSRVEIYQARLWRMALTNEIEWLFAELLRRGSPIRCDRFLCRPPRLSWRNSCPAEWWPVVPDPDLRLFQCRIPQAAWKSQVSDPDDALEELVGIMPSSLPPVILQTAPMESPRDLTVLQPVLSSDQAIHVHPQLLCSIDRAGENPTARFLALQSDAEQQDGDRLAFPHRRHQSPALSFESLPLELLVGCVLATWPPADFDQQRVQWVRHGLNFCDMHPVFESVSAVVDAWERGRLSLSQLIAVQLPLVKFTPDHQQYASGSGAARRYCTTAGRAVFNCLLPATSPFYDDTVTKSAAARIIRQVEGEHGAVRATGLIESLMQFARQVLTRSGQSLSVNDLRLPIRLPEILKEMNAKFLRAEKMYARGVITTPEHQQLLLNATADAQNRVDFELGSYLSSQVQTGTLLRSLALGAGAMPRQSRQMLCGICGSVHLRGSSRPHTIHPNYVSGLTMLDYWSVAAVRRSQNLEAQRPATAEAIRRRLVNLLRDVVITEEDCGTRSGLTIQSNGVNDDQESREEFLQSIAGRISLVTLADPLQHESLAISDAVITRSQAERIGAVGIRSVRVRHTLTCEARHGICRRCYGGDPDSGELVESGTPVGIRAALEIGALLSRLPRMVSHPHERPIIQSSEVVARMPGVVSLREIKLMVNRQGERMALSNTGRIELVNEHGKTMDRYEVPHGARIPVAAGDRVKAGTSLAEWSWSQLPVFARSDGAVRIIGARIRPWTLVSLEDSKGRQADGCLVPSNSDFAVRDGDVVKTGTLLAEVARIPPDQLTARSRDLREFCRILSLRPSRHPAVLAESDGTVEIEYDGLSACCAVRITDGTASPLRQVIRLTRRRTLIVRTGDKVESGDALTTGSVDLTHLVRLKGPTVCYWQIAERLRECLPFANRPAGFDERHLELLLTQLFRAVEVANAGDSGFPSGQIVSSGRILARNRGLRQLAMISDVPPEAQDIPQGPVTREEFDAVRARLRKAFPQSAPIQRTVPWPAGWIPLLRDWDAAACTGSPLSSGGFSPTQAALVQAALGGWSEEFSGVKDALLLGRLSQIGDGVRKSKGAEETPS